MKTTIKQAIIKFGVLVGVFAAFLAILWLMGGAAKADTKSLQESVEMSQADYDMGQAQAKSALIQTCNDWKALAEAKIDLATATKIQINLTKEQVQVDCSKAGDLVPVTFL